MTSRTQKVVSLSSTEAELYAATSGAIDTLFLKDCLQFLVPDATISHTLHDNSALRQLCNRLGSGRLRHVSGKLLWLQDLTHQGLLQTQVGKAVNISDAGTKPLTRRHHVGLLSMIGFIDGSGELVGRRHMDDILAKRFKANKGKKFSNSEMENVLRVLLTARMWQCATGSSALLETAQPFRLSDFAACFCFWVR